MANKRGPKRAAYTKAYNAAYTRHQEEIGLNSRIKREHMKRQLLGPVDAEPVRQFQGLVKQLSRFGGNPSHTRKSGGSHATPHGLFGSRKHHKGLFGH